MQDQELTGWFDLSDQKPWEPGVYEVDNLSKKYPSMRLYSFWNGHRFGWNEQFPWLAEMQGHHPTQRKEIKWRGLSSDPSAKTKPRRSVNPKVTRYVVTSDGDAVATFASKALAEAYAKSIEKRRASVVWVETIRFRSPE